MSSVEHRSGHQRLAGGIPGRCAARLVGFGRVHQIKMDAFAQNSGSALHGLQLHSGVFWVQQPVEPGPAGAHAAGHLDLIYGVGGHPIGVSGCSIQGTEVF